MSRRSSILQGRLLSRRRVKSGALPVRQYSSTDLVDITEDGKVGILVLGDSIFEVPTSTPGPTPDPDTVFQVNRINLTVTEIEATDMKDALGFVGSIGTSWPQFGIHYYNLSGYKPMILNQAKAGSKFDDWNSTYYPTAKIQANQFLLNQGLTRYRAIFVSLGINNRNDVEATVQTQCNLFFTNLLADFPDTPIFIHQAAQSLRFSTQLHMVKRMLKNKVIDNPLVNFSCDHQAIHAAGNFADSLHPNITGCNKMGKMDARALFDYGNYTKPALSIIASHFSDLSVAQKGKIQTFIDTIGEAAYYNLDYLALWRQDDQNSQVMDFAFMHGMQHLNSFFSADNIVGFISTTQHIKSGIVPSITLLRALFDDMFVIVNYKSNAGGSPAPDALAALFGGDNGSSAFKVYQVTASNEIRGRAGTIASDEIVDTTENFVADNSYGIRVEGTTAQLLKNGAPFGSPLSIVGAQNALTEQIIFGNVNVSGTPTNSRPMTSRYAAMGKSSAINKVILHNALEILVGDGIEPSAYLVAHWPLATKDGGNITPDIINGHDGSLIATIAAGGGPSGEDVADFGGSTQYLLVDDHGDFSFGDGAVDTPFTMYFKIYPDTISVQDMWLFNKREAGTQFEYQVRIKQTSGELEVTLFNNLAAIAYKRLTSGLTFTAGSWQEGIITWDGSQIKIYKDRVLSTGNTDGSVGTYVAMGSGTAKLAFAAQQWSVATGELDGKAFDLKIYKGIALTQEQIDLLP